MKEKYKQQFSGSKKLFTVDNRRKSPVHTRILCRYIWYKSIISINKFANLHKYLNSIDEE